MKGGLCCGLVVLFLFRGITHFAIFVYFCIAHWVSIRQ